MFEVCDHSPYAARMGMTNRCDQGAVGIASLLESINCGRQRGQTCQMSCRNGSTSRTEVEVRHWVDASYLLLLTVLVVPLIVLIVDLLLLLLHFLLRRCFKQQQHASIHSMTAVCFAALLVRNTHKTIARSVFFSTAKATQIINLPIPKKQSVWRIIFPGRDGISKTISYKFHIFPSFSIHQPSRFHRSPITASHLCTACPELPATPETIRHCGESISHRSSAWHGGKTWGGTTLGTAVVSLTPNGFVQIIIILM